MKPARRCVRAALAAAATAVLGASAPSPQDPVTQAPRYYTVIFENDRVRVLDYHLKPGEREGMHTHAYPHVAYALSDAAARITTPAGKVFELTFRQGRALWSEPVTHQFENLGRTELHALLVEVKR